MSLKKTIEILVAVRNEEENIPVLITKLKSLNINNSEIKILFLEDGSTDKTTEILKEYSRKEENVNYISLDNPYGQYAALIYGKKLSAADAVITMDADGGHPVSAVEEMIMKYIAGNNVVQGRREAYKRKKTYRAIGSYIYFSLYRIIVGVNMFKQNVMFRLLDNKAKSVFLENKNWWHIFKTNFKSKDNLKIEYVNYDAPERSAGESKYNFFKLLKLSYKSFYSLISIKRYIIINIIFIFLIVFIIINVNIYIGIVLVLILITEITSFAVIRNNYPVDKIKVLETSLQIKK